jgi:hypothetical protein
MAQQFPTFKYSDIKFDPTFAAPGAPALSFGTNPGTAPSFSGTDLTLDKALAYGVMQALNPDERAKARKEDLQSALEYQKQQIKQAAPYKLLFDLPGRITEAFALPGQIRLAGANAATQAAMQGIQAAANISSQPVAPIPRPNIQYF